MPKNTKDNRESLADDIQRETEQLDITETNQHPTPDPTKIAEDSGVMALTDDIQREAEQLDITEANQHPTPDPTKIAEDPADNSNSFDDTPSLNIPTLPKRRAFPRGKNSHDIERTSSTDSNDHVTSSDGYIKKVQQQNSTTSAGYLSNWITSSFNTVKERFTATEDTGEIDWDFWGKVVNDYDNIALRHSRTLSKKIHQGIPNPLRGTVWQLLSKGKNPELETMYTTQLSRESTHSKLIQRDLARTFPKHEYFQNEDGEGQIALFNVIKSYSLFDTEVGYCQGISFVVGALLLNMPEETAFCVLVQLMKTYKFRHLYTPNMHGLQLRLYQFEQLLKEHLPAVDTHLQHEGIKSTMYASQWFMTIFAYRFPLDIVFRIMDIIFAEGIESMFRIAIALLKKNASTIIQLEFEDLLEYLKNGLFDVYLEGGNGSSLIIDATMVVISIVRLEKLEAEFEESHKEENNDSIIGLKTQNRNLSDQLKRMEESYELLNKEHIELATENLDRKTQIQILQHKLEEANERIIGFRSILTDDRQRAEFAVKEEMNGLLQKNLELTHKNVELLDKIADLEQLYRDISLKLVEVEDERMELEKKTRDLKSILSGVE